MFLGEPVLALQRLWAAWNQSTPDLSTNLADWHPTTLNLIFSVVTTLPCSTLIFNALTIRAALHLEAGPIRCVRRLKSSLVIGQKAQIGPNPFTPRGRADLVV
jgi:hypothetical protein